MLESLTVLNDATFEVSIDKYDIHGVETGPYPHRCLAHGHGLFGDRQERCPGIPFAKLA